MASGLCAAPKGRTHGRTDQCCKREKSPCQLGANGMDPAHPGGRISDVDCSEGGSSCRSFELAWTWQSTCLRFMALTDRGMLSFAKPYVEDQSRRFLPICRLVWSGWKLPTARTTGHACLRSLVTRSA